MPTPNTFNAFRIHNDAAGYRGGIEQMSIDDLAPGEVVIKTAYSSVNYKDALAGTGQGKILRRFPLIGGIDVAGHVVASTDPEFKEGDAVLVTGSGLSETRDGGYRRVRAASKRSGRSRCRKGLSLRESMILGTAGFTAALALFRMSRTGRRRSSARSPSPAPPAASVRWPSTSSAAPASRCTRSPARPNTPITSRRSAPAQVLGRDALASARPMESARLGGGLDNVGGPMLAGLLAQTTPYGNVASAGLAASPRAATPR